MVSGWGSGTTGVGAACTGWCMEFTTCNKDNILINALKQPVTHQKCNKSQVAKDFLKHVTCVSALHSSTCSLSPLLYVVSEINCLFTN